MNVMDELRRNRTVFLAATRVQEEPEQTVRQMETPVRTQTVQPVPSAHETTAQTVYSLRSPHDVDASVKFPQSAAASTKTAEPDIWNTVLRRLETEARFRPQAFAEEELE